MAKSLNRKPLRKSCRKAGNLPQHSATLLGTHPALCGSFGYCMVKAGLIMRALLDNALGDSKIIAPQMGVLTVLCDSGPMSQIEIGTVLGIDKATMVKLIDDLEKQKYVTRIADMFDRRVKRIQISNAGKKVNERAIAVRTQFERDVLAALSFDERKQLAEILPKVLDHVRQMAMNKDRSPA